MAPFEKFHYASLEELREKIAQLGIYLPLSDDLSPLKKSVAIGGKTAPNALAVLPMEGCDSQADGSPSELVLRRYSRLSGGGAGLLWMEACAVTPEGRANPLQMYLHRENLIKFAELNTLIHREACSRHGHHPVTILQLTHSGRYSKPVGHTPAPLVPQHDPFLDPRVGLKPYAPVVTDDYLDELQEKYVACALLAKEAGFDGVDIKACHRYLVSELLASHTRPGKYGGSFENRTRFLLEVMDKVRKAVGQDFIIACRFNVFDAHPYPYGFGVDKEDCWRYDLKEPLRLVTELIRHGVQLLSNSAGNPYFRFPQVTRPFDLPALGGEIPDEHPLESVARLFLLSEQVQKAAGSVPVVGNGYTWLRQFFPYAGAANLQAGRISLVGMGRQAFAYPDAPEDIFTKGALDPGKVCIACSKCTQIMRDQGRTGCVARDRDVYLPLYTQARQEAEDRIHHT
jgi:2,4-dienoyl-CoA reductase (NADPH2)